MNRRNEKPPGLTRSRGFSKIGHRDDDQRQAYKVDALAHWQARRDLAELRAVIADYDEGLLDLEALAWELGRLGASLGAKAARGELRAA